MKYQGKDYAYIGYKKARSLDSDVIVKLGIPYGVLVRTPNRGDHRKYRAAKAVVLSITHCDDKDRHVSYPVYSIYDSGFYYTVGQTVKPRNKFSKRDIACASGIHFFCSRKLAENY